MKVEEIIEAHEWLASLGDVKQEPTSQDAVTAITLLKKLLASVQQNYSSHVQQPEEKWIKEKINAFRGLL